MSLGLVHKVLVGQNVLSISPIYKSMEKAPKCEANAKFTQKANLVERKSYCEQFYYRNGHNDRAHLSNTCLPKSETLLTQVFKKTQRYNGSYLQN